MGFGEVVVFRRTGRPRYDVKSAVEDEEAALLIAGVELLGRGEGEAVAAADAVAEAGAC